MKRRKARKISRKRIITGIMAVSALAGIAVFFCVITLFALITTFFDVPEFLISVFSAVSLSAGAFISGKTGGYLFRHKGIYSGIICSAATLLLSLLLFLCTDETVSPDRMILMTAVSCISGAAGGVSGVNRHIKGRLPVCLSDSAN